MTVRDNRSPAAALINFLSVVIVVLSENNKKSKSKSNNNMKGTKPNAADYGGHPAPTGPALPNLINAVKMLKSTSTPARFWLWLSPR